MKQANNIEILSFNIAHGMGMDGKVDLERAARIIEESGADVVGLQEVDRHFGERTSFVDQVSWLQKRLNMNVAYGANIQIERKQENGLAGEYGNMILTKYPITKVKNHHLLIEGPGFCGDEQRGMLEVEIIVGNQNITIFNAHLALEEIEKESNVNEILEIAKKAKRPRILIGDFNALSDSIQIGRLKEVFCDVFEEMGEGEHCTFPSPYHNKITGEKIIPFIRIDYILADTKWVVEHAGRIITDVSDHLPIKARFKLK